MFTQTVNDDLIKVVLENDPPLVARDVELSLARHIPVVVRGGMTTMPGMTVPDLGGLPHPVAHVSEMIRRTRFLEVWLSQQQKVRGINGNVCFYY